MLKKVDTLMLIMPLCGIQIGRKKCVIEIIALKILGFHNCLGECYRTGEIFAVSSVFFI